MTEKKRYYRDFSGESGTIIRDRTIDGELGEVFEFGMSDSKDLCDLLNEQEERIKELSNELEIYRNIKNVLEDGGVLLTEKQLKSIIEMKMGDVG